MQQLWTLMLMRVQVEYRMNTGIQVQLGHSEHVSPLLPVGYNLNLAAVS